MINEEHLDKLFDINKNLQAAGMAPLSDEEIRAWHQKMASLAPSASQMTPNIPTAGFQGNSMFPNQGGSGIMPSPHMMPPGSNPGFQQGINPGIQQGIGQGVQQGIGGGVQQGIGQGVQQGINSGMDLNIRLGPDGQPQQMLLRRLRAGARRQV